MKFDWTSKDTVIFGNWQFFIDVPTDAAQRAEITKALAHAFLCGRRAKLAELKNILEIPAK